MQATYFPALRQNVREAAIPSWMVELCARRATQLRHPLWQQRYASVVKVFWSDWSPWQMSETPKQLQLKKTKKKIEPQCPISENGRVCLTCPLFLALHEESTQHAQNNNIYPIQSVSEYSMNFAGHCSEPAFSFWSVLQWKAWLLIKTKGKCFDDVLSGSIFVQCEEGNVSTHWDLQKYLQSAMEAVWLKRLQRYFLWHGRSSF